MRRYLTIALAAGLLGCHGSRPAATGTGATAGAEPPPADLQTIRVAIHRDPIAFLPFRVAQALGYYRQEGLEVDLSEVAGGTKAIEALLGGSVDVAAGSLSDAIALAVQGRSVRSFLVLYDRPTVALAVAPAMSKTILTVGDLKGRTVGVSAPGSASHQILNFLLVTHGLSPDQVSTVSVGMSAGSVAALEHGKVDAAILIASAISTFEQRQAAPGFLVDTRTLAGTKAVFGSEIFPALSLLAEDGWLHDHGDAAQRLVRAVMKGMRWMHDQPAAEVRTMIPAASRMATAEAEIRAIGDAQQAMSTDGRMPADSPDLIRKFVAVSDDKVRAARLELAKVFTNDFAALK